MLFTSTPVSDSISRLGTEQPLSEELSSSPESECSNPEISAQKSVYSKHTQNKIRDWKPEVLSAGHLQSLSTEAIDLMLSNNPSGSAQNFGAIEFGPIETDVMRRPATAFKGGPVGPSELPVRVGGEYDGRTGIFLLGTGPSTSIPQIEHIFSTVINPGEGSTKKCRNCLAAWADPNHPNNCDNICAVVAIPEIAESSEISGDERTSLISSPTLALFSAVTHDAAVRQSDPGSRKKGNLPPGSNLPPCKKRKHVLIDMGKTFRQSMLKWMPKFGITQIDAVLLSHEHQDAFGGMDELRCLQKFGAAGCDDDKGIYKYAVQTRLPVVLSEKCMEAVGRAYYYIVEASEAPGPIDRKVAVVDFIPQKVPDDADPIDDTVDNLEIPVPILNRLNIKKLPVYHGGDFVSLGYAFGNGYETVVYISDVSWFSDRTMAIIDSLVPFKVLIIDSLYDSYPHFSHLCLYEAYDLIDRWRPAETYILGMGCMIDRLRMNNHLQEVVLPNLRSGSYCPYPFNCVGADEPQSFRPLRARMRLQEMPPIPKRPEPEHIKSIQVAIDGTFIPVDFQLKEQ